MATRGPREGPDEASEPRVDKKSFIGRTPRAVFSSAGISWPRASSWQCLDAMRYCVPPKKLVDCLHESLQKSLIINPCVGF